MTDRFIKAIDKFFHDLAIIDLQRSYTDFDTSDLSYHDTLYLNIIEAHPNRYTSSQIADLLKVTRPAVTQKINVLVKKGYIIRTQSETDKRVFYLAINPKKSFYNDEDRKFDKKFTKVLEEKYGEEMLEKLCEMIEFYAESIYNETINEVKNDK